MSPRVGLAAFAVLCAVLVGCGRDPALEGAGPGRGVVDVEMRDISFSPATVRVRAGHTVRFDFVNRGKLVHEAVLGDAAAQMAHERAMADPGVHGSSSMDRGMPGMGATSSTKTAWSRDSAVGVAEVTLAPGATGHFTHTFTRHDDGLIIGCHEAGHYQAGMRLRVVVTA